MEEIIMRNNIEQQKLISIKQVKSAKKSKLIKNGFIFFAMSIFVLLNIHIKSKESFQPLQRARQRLQRDHGDCPRPQKY